jgi:YD repeat-containing protein
MMKQSSRIEAPFRSQRVQRAGRFCRLAVLVAVTAGAGCDSDPDDPPGDPPDAAPTPPPDAEPPPPPDALPIDFARSPCGVEERFVDGQLIAYEHRGYDEQGNHVLTERDEDRDGVPDSRAVWQYAPAGGLTLVEEQSVSNGNTISVSAQYAADGRLDFVTWTTTTGGDGRADYEYDGEQRILEHWDRDEDGVAEGLTTYTYDAEGKLEESAFGCVGMEPESVTTMQWGVGGRIERIETRDNGVLTTVTQYAYDQEGRLEGWERSEEDRIVASESFEYDAEGNVTGKSEVSSRAFGDMEPIVTKTDTVYDVHGRPLSAEDTLDDMVVSSDVYLYECPDHAESPGRFVGEIASPFPVAPAGPRAGMSRDAIAHYLSSASSCL